MREFIFYFCAAVTGFIYFGYPLVIGFLAAIWKKPHRVDDTFTPLLTLLIPAYNEEKVIREKLENTLALDYPKDKLETIVLVDESTDRTEEIAGSYRSRGISTWVQRPRQGKMAALNTMAPKAKGEIIVFSDANSMYRKDALRKLARHFSDRSIGLVCGELKLIDGRTMTGIGENFYWKYEQFLKRKESGLRQLLVVNGSIYAIRKELFSAVPPDLADDFVLPMRIAKRGHGLIYEPEAVNEEKTSVTEIDEFRRKTRIISQGVRAAFFMFPEIVTASPLRVFEFLFHKFLRWFVFAFTALMFVLNAMLLHRPLFRVYFAVQVVFYGFALAGYVMQRYKRVPRIFLAPFYFYLVNLASFCGVVRAFAGKTKPTWEKAESTR